MCVFVFLLKLIFFLLQKIYRNVIIRGSVQSPTRMPWLSGAIKAWAAVKPHPPLRVLREIVEMLHGAVVSVDDDTGDLLLAGLHELPVVDAAVGSELCALLETLLHAVQLAEKRRYVLVDSAVVLVKEQLGGGWVSFVDFRGDLQEGVASQQWLVPRQSVDALCVGIAQWALHNACAEHFCRVSPC